MSGASKLPPTTDVEMNQKCYSVNCQKIDAFRNKGIGIDMRGKY